MITDHDSSDTFTTNQDRADETADLLRTATTASADARDRCLHRIVLLHLDLADALARRYEGRGIDSADLTQTARLALAEAVKRADIERGAFLPFAVSTIRGSLKRYFRDHGWMIRPPRRIQELQHEMGDAWAELGQRQGQIPNRKQLACRLGETPAHIAEASAAGTCFHPTSLDAPSRPGFDADATFGDSLGRSDSNYDRVEWATALHSVCRTLSAEDRRVLYLRFFEQRTQQEIADELGVSQMQISRLLRRILTQLQHRLGQRGADPTQGRPAAA